MRIRYRHEHLIHIFWKLHFIVNDKPTYVFNMIIVQNLYCSASLAQICLIIREYDNCCEYSKEILFDLKKFLEIEPAIVDFTLFLDRVVIKVYGLYVDHMRLNLVVVLFIHS